MRYASFRTRVTDRAGTIAPHHLAYLQVRNTKRRWVTVKSVRTSTTGYASASYRITRSAYFRWTVAGTNVVSPAKLVRATR
jgi:hypothetical protein